MTSMEIQELPLFNIQEALEKEDIDSHEMRRMPSSFLDQQQLAEKQIHD